MSEDIRWKQRFSNYQKALRQLQKFIDKGELSELEEQGLIKSFEYTYELAWNTLKDFLEFQGHSDIFGSRDAIRKAFQLDIIEDGEVWMDMIKSRNRTSHTYNEDTAKEISKTVISVYYHAFQKMNDKLDSLKDNDQ
ncbi:nucleotidyltransferase substrate binding protein [Candidatus Electrothrix sp.]|uniref:nucleotidyltransferase substrate binding protein n=1 Tax=Candidatus Electrothrix sp. TaxID=2170559 RepID=UPI0040564AC5